MLAFEPLLSDVMPDVVVVVGDVNSTLACGLVAAKSPAKLAHVEAGLRSGDWSMPEEVNRVAVDHISDLLFAPSPDAVDNLLAEGLDDRRVHLVGNVMVDTLLASVDRATTGDALARLGLAPREYGVVTLHRPSNIDDPTTFTRVMDGLARVSLDLPLVLPVHPRAATRLDAHGPVPGLRIVPALGYLDFLALEANARLVLTDSGGVQEETTALGVPCLTLRENTERPITVTEGTNTVVGTDPAVIASVARQVLCAPVPRRCPALWDGKASIRIADAIIAEMFNGPVRTRS
jgi:UDP-N-acetylglucosamine 2-epimerase (non-hydrolysing)